MAESHPHGVGYLIPVEHTTQAIQTPLEDIALTAACCCWGHVVCVIMGALLS